MNGNNWDHWTEWNELWYQERLLAIRRGDRKDGIPLVSNAWRDRLKGAAPWRRLTQALRDESAKLFCA